MNKPLGIEQQDEDIDTSDIPEITMIQFENAFILVPIDRDIAAWFHQQGYKLKPKVNQVLREFMHASAAAPPAFP